MQKLLLTLCIALGLTVPAQAANFLNTDKLPAEATAAYPDIVKELAASKGTSTSPKTNIGGHSAYTGFTDGYVADIGGSETPELIVAHSKSGYTYQSYIDIYTWNGTSARKATTQRVMAGMTGRFWVEYALTEANGSFCFEQTTASMNEGTYPAYYRLNGNKLTEIKLLKSSAGERKMLGVYDHIIFQNADELMSALSAAPAAPAINVLINGEAVTWEDAMPIVRDNRTLVPLRAIANAMGLEVLWDGAAREAIFSDGNDELHFPLDQTTAYSAGGETIEMDTAPVVVDSRTYAPAQNSRRTGAFMQRFPGCRLRSLPDRPII